MLFLYGKPLIKTVSGFSLMPPGLITAVAGTKYGSGNAGHSGKARAGSGVEANVYFEERNGINGLPFTHTARRGLYLRIDRREKSEDSFGLSPIPRHLLEF